MANRRMFSKTITSSSRFLMMPQSSQNLYFHFGMNADDDGFCEHFMIMRMVEAKPDDLKVLQAKGFVQVFDDKVLIITDWKENNYLRPDRYQPSKYLEIYKQEIAQISTENNTSLFGIPSGNQMDTQVRKGKVRKGKDIHTVAEPTDDVQDLIEEFKPLNPSYERLFANKTQRAALERLVKKYGKEKIRGTIQYAASIKSQQYAPSIKDPYELEYKLAKLADFKRKKDTTQPHLIKI